MERDQTPQSESEKNKNHPDSKIFIAKTFQIKHVNHINFQIHGKCESKVCLHDSKHENGPDMIHEKGEQFAFKHLFDNFDLMYAKFNSALFKSSGNSPDHPETL